MPNVIASGTTVSNGTLKRNNFLIGVNTSVQYGPTSATTFWNGIVPAAGGYTVYAQKTVNGPSIRTAANDSELITIARQYGGTNITTVLDALNYFNGQSNNLVTNIDYPSIVTSGMVLNLDAGYVPSYPTNGTTWTDLSGNGFNGTLTNGPNFSSLGGGSIVFDGSNDYVSITDNVTLRPSVFTMNIWVKKNSLTQVQSILFTKRFSASAAPYNSYSIQQDPGTGLPYKFSIGTGIDQYFLSTVNINDLLWHNLVMTYDNSTIVGYLDGVNIGSLSAPGPISYSSLGLFMAGSFYGGTSSFNGNISCFFIYNRVLSATEVLQNYNALKSRFGL
jgi:hypothetical protein